MRQGFCQEGCGACCKFLTLIVHPDYGKVEDVRRWVELHGIKLRERAGSVVAYIPIPCSALQPDMSCGIHATRPDVCNTWPNSQADIDELHNFTDGPVCTYWFDSGHTGQGVTNE